MFLKRFVICSAVLFIGLFFGSFSYAQTGNTFSGTVAGDNEFLEALQRMYTAGMTKYDTLDDFRPYDFVTRQEGAKFFSVFTKQVLLKTLDTGKYCFFDDLEKADPTLKNGILESCMLGIFNGSSGYFFPNKIFTKAQALAVLMRALEGPLDESGEYRWAPYLVRARELGLTKEFIVEDLDKPVTRYEIALLLYRAKGIGTAVGGM